MLLCGLSFLHTVNMVNLQSMQSHLVRHVNKFFNLLSVAVACHWVGIFSTKAFINVHLKYI